LTARDCPVTLRDAPCGVKRKTRDASLSRSAILSGLLLVGALFNPDPAAASCTRSKAAAYYAYDYATDSYILQSVYDDGVDIGNSAPIDEHGRPYEMMSDTWEFYPPPGWDGSYPPTHLFGSESGSKKEASGPALRSGGNCTKLPPVVVHGQRQSSSGILRMHIVARAPRNPAPGMDGVWFGEMAARSYTGIPQYDRVCSGMEVDTGTCANACRTFMSAPVGSTCSVSINGGNGTLICRRVSGSQDSTNWQPVTCQM
jgi:hypothetical protein